MHPLHHAQVHLPKLIYIVGQALGLSHLPWNRMVHLLLLDGPFKLFFVDHLICNLNPLLWRVAALHLRLCKLRDQPRGLLHLHPTGRVHLPLQRKRSQPSWPGYTEGLLLQRKPRYPFHPHHHHHQEARHLYYQRIRPSKHQTISQTLKMNHQRK
jgi:hypothetical protein